MTEYEAYNDPAAIIGKGPGYVVTDAVLRLRPKEEEKKEMPGESEGQPSVARLADYDQACEDCLSKQFIRDRLEALWTAHAQNQNHWLRTAVADVAEALGVPLECAKRSDNDGNLKEK